MKKNLLLFFRKTALFCILACVAGSCIKGNDVDVVTQRVFVNYRDWTWNDVYSRWECLVDWPYITDHIYDQATAVGNVYVNETDINERVYTTSKTMPFVHTFLDANNRIFTETISFDISPGSVCFYIQSSDIDIRREPFQDEYEFKVMVILEN